MPAPAVAGRRLPHCGSQVLEHTFYNFGTQAELFHGIWGPLGPGIKHTPPALAEHLFITEPPEKSLSLIFKKIIEIQLIYNAVLLFHG